MNKLFDIHDIKPVSQTGILDKSAVLRDNFLALHDFKLESLKSLCNRFPEPNEFFALWTLKSFNAFTIIPYTIKVFGVIDRLTISTYSINKRIIDSLIKKYDQQRIKHITIFISDSLKNRMPSVVDHLNFSTHGRPNISIIFAWNHSKITLIETQGKYFVFEGSGNWSENAQYEQYLFFQYQRLYEFRLKCLTDDFN